MATLRRKRGPMSEINVVPYVDVMLVLLVIFMVTAPLVTPGVIDLPSVGKAGQPKMVPVEIIVRDNEKMTVRERDRAGAIVNEQPVTRSSLTQLIKQRQAKNPELGASSSHERRGHARDEVRTRPVVCEPPRGLQDPGNHCCRRRFPVRRGDQCRALRKPGCEPVDRSRIELREQLSGQRRAAAGAGEPGQAGGGTGEADLECKRNAHGGTLPRPRADHSFEGTFGVLTLPGDVGAPSTTLRSARISRRELSGFGASRQTCGPREGAERRHGR